LVDLFEVAYCVFHGLGSDLFFVSELIILKL
jgi:hypothetical protein